MRRNLALTLALGATLTVAVAAVAIAVPITIPTTWPPNLIIKFGGGVTPKTLPKHELAPVALRIRGRISTVDGTHPFAFREAVVDLDKNGTINARGLPVCKRKQLKARGTTKAARRVCGRSIIGTGIAHVEIESPERGPIKVPSPLTLFNGGVKRGTTTLFIHAFITVPTPVAIVTTVKVRKIHEGRYGLQAVSKIPRIAAGSGSVLDFSFKIKRLFKYKGKKRSYMMARCLDRHLIAKITKTVFKDEAGSGTTTGTDIMIQSCTPKG